MQYCERCKVQVLCPSNRCPLCQGKLEGKPEKEGQLFPDMTREKSVITLFMRIFTFSCIAVVVLSFAINLMIPVRVFWAGFSSAAVVCVWVLTAVAIYKRKNLLKNTLWEMVLLCGICVLWDFLTGYRGWSLEYGIPITILLVFPVLTMIVKILHLPSVYYMIYYIMTCLAGILQMIFWVTGLVPMKIPVILCGTVSILILAGLIIFQGRSFWEEIRKKTYM